MKCFLTMTLTALIFIVPTIAPTPKPTKKPTRRPTSKPTRPGMFSWAGKFWAQLPRWVSPFYLSYWNLLWCLGRIACFFFFFLKKHQVFKIIWFFMCEYFKYIRCCFFAETILDSIYKSWSHHFNSNEKHRSSCKILMWEAKQGWVLFFHSAEYPSKQGETVCSSFLWKVLSPISDWLFIFQPIFDLFSSFLCVLTTNLHSIGVSKWLTLNIYFFYKKNVSILP